MQEIGIDSEYMPHILNGTKTVEGRLGKPEYIKLRVGDVLSIREDVRQDGKVIMTTPDRARIEITQILYFETLHEMLQSINYRTAIPDAQSVDEALAEYRKFYSEQDEDEYGAMAITFSVL